MIIFSKGLTRKTVKALGKRWSMLAFTTSQHFIHQVLMAKEQHPEETEEQIIARAEARIIYNWKSHPLLKWLLIVGLLLGALGGAKLAHGQTVNGNLIRIQGDAAFYDPANHAILVKCVASTCSGTGGPGGGVVQQGAQDLTAQPWQIDIQKYLGTTIGAANPVHVQLVVGGVVVDPRSIRLLTSSDVVDVSDRSGRLLGAIANTGFNVNNFPTTQAINFTQYLGVAPGTANPVHTQLVVGAAVIDPRSIRALAPTDNVTVTPPTLTKGTQGATGFSVQSLKDAGRSRIMFTADAVGVATTEGLVTFTKDVAGTATTAQTTYSVTAAKIFRVQSLSISITASSTTVARVRVRLRENTGGACIATSPLVWTGDFGPPTGTLAAGVGYNGAPYFVNFPDGLEFPAADSLCLSEVATTNATAFLSVALIGYEY